MTRLNIHQEGQVHKRPWVCYGLPHGQRHPEIWGDCEWLTFMRDLLFAFNHVFIWLVYSSLFIIIIIIIIIITVIIIYLVV